MDINDVISKAKEIVRSHYQGMKANDIPGEPAMLKKDFLGALKAMVPGVQDSYISRVYAALQERGDISTISNDTITFSCDFANG